MPRTLQDSHYINWKARVSELLEKRRIIITPEVIYRMEWLYLAYSGVTPRQALADIEQLLME